MNIQELIKEYEGAPFSIISINGVLEDLKQLDEPQPIKLKDVITRIENFDLGTKAVWINEILYKLGSDYGLHKYYEGYKQGKFEGSMEREKVTVPQFVADWVEKSKTVASGTLKGAYINAPEKVRFWWSGDNIANVQVFARAWLDGYLIEKEKRYLVKMKGNIYENILVYGFGVKRYFFSSRDEGNRRAKHTRKELEEAGFGDVFNSPLFEVEEVKSNEME